MFNNMHPTRTPFTAVLAVLALTSITHGQAKSTAPADFDIVSIKLHMTGGEVVDALRSRFGASLDPVNGIQVVTTSPGRYSQSPYISQIHYKTKDFSLDVQFWEIYPASSARREGVYRISYVANTKTQADIEAMRQKVRVKYGPPSGAGPTGEMWCQAASCDLNEPLLNARPTPIDPGFYLGLTDEGFRKRMEQAFSKATTVSPPL